jgi:hypothetical protein
MERRWIPGRLEKGGKNKAENYHGITLLCTGYKLYASILSGRMKREIEEKGVIPADSQAGFREGMGTMDNVYLHPGSFNKER